MSAQRRRPLAGRPVIVHLPILDTTNALSFINVLDALIEAVWRAHGGSIIAIRTDLVAAAVPPPPVPPRKSEDDLF